MRKQDRIAHQQQSRTPEPATQTPQSRPKEEERVKGSAPQTQHPQRQPGKLPLPD